MSRVALVTDYAWHSLEIEAGVLQAADTRVVSARGLAMPEVMELASRADAILTCWARVPGRMLDAAVGCKVVSRYGVGLDNIDVVRASELGIVVTNVPDYCVDEVADHALALILAAERRIVSFADQTRSGGWDNQGAGPIRRISTITLGLIGYGRIARNLAVKARALGMKVVAFSPSVTTLDPLTNMAPDLDSLLRLSDVVSLHVPLTQATRHLIDARALCLMRDGAVLINTSRGDVVDLGAVLEALRHGKLRTAALDVLGHEPPEGDWVTTPGLILTPHAAFYSTESVAELQRRAAENVRDVLLGQRPEHIVNEEVLRGPLLRARWRPL